jgi:hypothetical protein
MTPNFPSRENFRGFRDFHDFFPSKNKLKNNSDRPMLMNPQTKAEGASSEYLAMGHVIDFPRES